MIRKHFVCAAGISLLFVGCSHHSVRVEAVKSPDNRLIITEEVRPWPITMHRQIEIILPLGDYAYDPREYESQTSLPEKPIYSLKHSEFTIRTRGEVVTSVNYGWIAIFRDGVEIQLLWDERPASINGRYRTKMPFIRPEKN